MATGRTAAGLGKMRPAGQASLVLGLAALSPAVAWRAFALASAGEWGWAVAWFVAHGGAVYVLCAAVARLGPCDSTALGWAASWGWLIGGYAALLPLGLMSPLHALGGVLVIGAGVVLLLVGVRGAERELSVRDARRRRGECQACGYSLAGVPPGNPCPECGAIGGVPAEI